MDDSFAANPLPPRSGHPFERLLFQARDGSRDALGRLLELFRDYLDVVAEANLDSAVRPKAGVSDLVQESMLDAQRDFAGFRGKSEAEFRAWLKRILLNNLLNQYRAWRGTQKRQLSLEAQSSPSGLLRQAPADDSSPSQIASQREQEELLDQALARLPPHYRQAILLRHRDGCGFAEIGQQLGRTSDAARMLWYRAYAQLAVELEALGAAASSIAVPQ